jgi:hypothetical protein
MKIVLFRSGRCGLLGGWHVAWRVKTPFVSTLVYGDEPGVAYSVLMAAMVLTNSGANHSIAVRLPPRWRTQSHGQSPDARD